MQETDDAYVGGDVTVIGSKVSGYITEVLVTDNQAVRAGDVLARIDDRDYRAVLAKAEGAIAAQQALLANLEATQRLQEAVIGQARASVAATDAETRRAHDDQVRYASLVAKEAVSVQSSQKADADYKQSRANGDKAQAALIAAQRQIDVIATQKQQAQAALAQATAERDLARLNVGYTELRAPVDGTIGNRRARVGAYASSGAALMSIVPASGLWVDANFKESQLAHESGHARHDRRRCDAGSRIPWSGRKPGAGHRCAVQRSAARECHRQLHEDRAARAGADRARRKGCAARAAAARPVGDR